jgi:UDP-N-acetylglucosamine 1-carboxyvinyltransferase
MAAMAMIPGEITITNVPNLTDVTTMIRMLRSLGMGAEYLEPNTVRAWPKMNLRHIVPYDLVTKMRASFFIAGPLLARVGMAKIPLPGGCAIGTRPIDIHLKGFEKLGAKINVQHGMVEIRAPKLVGAKINLDFPSVGATENLIMAACAAEGTTLIENAACEPEIEDLANFLNKAGAEIKGAGTTMVEIQGGKALRNVKNYAIIPDRIEAGTMILAAAITRGEVLVDHLNSAHLQATLEKLKAAGVHLEIKPHSVKVIPNGRWENIDIETQPYPGFPTDMQAQMMTLLSLAEGTSVITETVFENRFIHAQELNRMGANIKISHEHAVIHGVEKLSGAPVQITDLRAGAALFLAGLGAEGETLLYGLKHIHRGYERLIEKLNGLGADVEEFE